MVFLFAPAFHPAMRHVGPVRKELAVPTIMNLLGPLSNPAGVRHQVIGVADAHRAPLIAEALRRLNEGHALVVHGEAGMDEIAPAGRTLVWEVRDGAVATWEIVPAAYGLEIADMAELRGSEPRRNAERVRRLFEKPGADRAGRATVTLNAAAAVYVAGLAKDFKSAVERAGASLERGDAANALERFLGAAAPRTSG
jgi:anthranilate phosphoribosyltransferase